MVDFCDRCAEMFDPDAGDGARCETCGLMLCELCFGNRADDAIGPVCKRCRKAAEKAGVAK